jgi:ribosomal protein S12 methylthiotransferase
VPYFDLSLQHVSPPLLRRMKRWGDGDRFSDLIADLRARTDGRAVIRSSFIVGFPGETEADHDQLLEFLDAQRIEWAGLFAYSREDGTAAAVLDGAVPDGLVAERLRELSELQDAITADARHALVGARVDVLIDEVDAETAVGRTFREAPEIDGIVTITSGEIDAMVPGTFVEAIVDGVEGPDLTATLLLDRADAAGAGASQAHSGAIPTAGG